MHKHKQSQCKRKVKHRKNLMGLIIILHNCVHCVYVCLLSEPEKKKYLSGRNGWKPS